MQENYLAKWLNNELTEKELAEFKKSAEYASYQRIVDASKGIKAPEFNVEEEWTSFKAMNINTESKVVQLNPFRQFLRIAAVIAVLLGGAYFYLNSQNTTFSAELAERTDVRLPDASEVILNADSELSFSEKNWAENRNVILNGEAFFKVAKGEKFTVTTKAGTVSVLGTQFNVENRDGFFEVSCYEGLVSVSFKGEELKLPAGSSFIAINGYIQKLKVPENTQPSWMRNESTFSSIPLKYVFAEFERQFNVKVTTENVDTEQLFTGTFDNTEINLALESISTPSQIRYKLEGDKVLFYAGNTP